MTTHRNRFGWKKRTSGKRSPVGTVLSKRYPLGTFEPLETRRLLAADAMTSAYHATDLHAFSLRSMLASSHQLSKAAALSSTSDVAPPPATSSISTSSAADSPAATTSDTDSPVAQPLTEPVAEPLAEGDLMRIRLEAQDASGNPITSIDVGQQFFLVAQVKDLRVPTPQFGGVYAAYTNVAFDTGKVTVNASTFSHNENSAGPPNEGFYSLTPGGTFGTPGTILGAGGAATSLSAPGVAEKFLWRVQFTATASGDAVFTPSFDDAESHDPLLYTYDPDILPEELEFISLTLDINGPPTASITQAVAHNEGNTGTTEYLFTVNLSSESAQQVTVAYATIADTASSTPPNADFTAQSATLTFTAGQTSKVITIAVAGDAAIEADEQFTVVLGAVTNATIAAGLGTGTATITNDDFALLSIESVTEDEGNETHTMEFTVSLSNPSSTVILVPYTTADSDPISATGGTEAPADYISQSGTLTFAVNSTASQVITITILGDTTFEQDETFRLVLSDPVNADFDAGLGIGVATLVNDDGPNLTIQGIAANEGNTATTDFVFVVNTNFDSDEEITVQFHTNEGTASLDDDDYTATNGTLTFAAHETTKNITVQVKGDLRNELDETFSVTLDNVSANATIRTATAIGAINNDDALPTLAISSPAPVTEGNAATTTPVVFTVTLSAASGQTVTVQFQTANGTATGGATTFDFQGTSGTLTFAPDETQKLITVLVNGDTADEENETFSVDLFNSTNAANAVTVLTKISGSTTINDDDAPPTLTLGAISKAEGNSGDNLYTFTAQLSQASGKTITVEYDTANGTATTADNDYVAASGTLTFAPGATFQTFTVTVKGDTRNETDETFAVNLSEETNVTLSNDSTDGTITNDDPLPTISINNAAPLNEGNSGLTSFSFTVTLSAASGREVTVEFSTLDGTATTTDADYGGRTGTLTFSPGETSKIIEVLVNGDNRNEADETFNVSLTAGSAVNGTISTTQASGQGLILNDDPVPTLAINDISLQEGDTGTTNFVFSITLTPSSGRVVTVAYDTADGSGANGAKAGSDYNATSGTLTFGVGVTTQNVTVQVKGDTFDEGNETFQLQLKNPVNAGPNTLAGTATILDEAGDTDIETIPSSLSGRVFADVDNSTAYEDGESGIPDVDVTLTSTLAGFQAITKTTGSDGTYTFTNLNPGTYTVTFEQPDGYSAATVKLGALDGATVAPDTTAALDYTVTIAAPGGVDGTGHNLYSLGLSPENISMRPFLASAHQTGNSNSNGASPLASPLAARTLASSAADASITQSGSTLTVHGTAGDDHFEFTASTHTITVNGVAQQFDPSEVTEVVFEGGGGSDTATLNGDDGNDAATVGIGFGTLTGSNYKVSASNVTWVTVDGGGGADQAAVQDSALSDFLQTEGDELLLVNDVGTTTLHGFEQVKASSTHGGSDTIHMEATDFAFEQEGAWLAG